MNLKDKIEIYKKAKEEFKYSIHFTFDSRNFTVDEIVDPLFRNEFLELIVRPSTFYDWNNQKISNDVVFANFIIDSTLNYPKEDIKKILKELVIINKNENLNLVNKRLIIENANIFMEVILEENAIDILDLSSKEQVNQMLKQTVKSANYENIKKLYNSMSNINYDFESWPLVIINKNMSKDQRIEMVKKTYIKKNLTKYASFLRENLSDIETLDTFIQATIIENNRVKEKGDSIRDIFRRVFIGMRGEWNIGNIDNYENIDEFLSKYKIYFNASNINSLIDDGNFSRRNNAIKLFAKMFKDETFEIKMGLIEKVKSLGQELYSVKNMNEFPKDVKGNDEREIMFLNYIIEVKNIKELVNSFGLEELISLINKHFNSLSKSFMSNFSSSMTFNNSYSWRNFDVEQKVKILKLLNDDIIASEKFSLFNQKETDLNNLGLNDSNNNNYWKLIDGVEKYLDSCGFVILLTSSYKFEKKSLMEKFYNLFFENLTDSQFVSSDLLEVVVNSFQNNEFITQLSNYLNRVDNNIMSASNNELNAFLDLILSLFSRIFPEKVEEQKQIKENLDSLKMASKLILNL